MLNKNLNHPYVIGKIYYIENQVDTSKLLYAGEISLETGLNSLVVAAGLQRLEFRCKEINANSYKLKSHSIKDTTLTMIFSAYFIGEKMAERMKQHHIQNRLFVTNNIYDTLNRTLIVNEEDLRFSCNGFVQFDVNTDSTIVLKTNIESTQDYKVKVKQNQDAVFLTIGFKKNYSYGLIPYTVWYLSNRYALHTFERFYKLDYNTGRVLVEIFPEAKQISVN